MQEGLNFLIVAYLESLQKDLPEDEKESLEVAIQCLTGVFQIDASDQQKKKNYTSSSSLPQIYSQYLAKANEEKKPIDEQTKQKAEQLKNEGNKEMGGKKYEEAIQKYTAAIDLWPENAIYYSNRAAAYSCLKKFKEAVTDCHLSIEKDSAYGKAYSRLGLAHFHLGEYEESVKAYEKAVEIEPGNEKLSSELKMAKEKFLEMAKEREREREKEREKERNRPPNPGMGGMPDFSALLNNPNLASMAASMMGNPAIQRMMQDPNISRMAEQFMSGERGVQDMMGDPSIMNAAQSFASQNPDLLNQMRGSLGNAPGADAPAGTRSNIEDIDD